ncbi:phage tail protein [Microlunatus sp. Gsoil 973]|jgi:microcystin-dependent protein|uniref:phage tail protein n=1 Tax=Microlunatus sp. Gsoil 973 TaxID=2672569 RepID=UPI0012B4D12C|nr:tail fiber protein [Microlunatus sp. Gsoil 973]QGN34367.1 phage tail protein [Microlunatus sp. Gsoil 973]
MSDPFLGEIRLVSFNFPPRGWAFCNGQLLQINQNQALFSIVGTTYGGDGRTTFALPNFAGRMPIHQGQGFTVGQQGGEATHTLTVAEMPAHNHPALAGGAANGSSPNGTTWAPADGALEYSNAANTTMSRAAIADGGGNQAHENRPPFLVLNFIIALVGVYPSAN